jgi:hypothetical protein
VASFSAPLFIHIVNPKTRNYTLSPLLRLRVTRRLGYKSVKYITRLSLGKKLG